MIFRAAVDAFLSAPPGERASASLELRNLSGTRLGGKRSAQESLLTVRGDGGLEFFQRGDFGERGGEPPGLWRGRCEASEVETVWRALRDLDQAAFPSRPADPGETAYELQAAAGGRVARLGWGPGLPGVACPGEDAIEPLRMLAASAQQETVWEVRARPGAVARTAGGLSLALELSNGGSEDVTLVLAPPGQGVDFLFKHAVAEDEEPDVTPLPVAWTRQPLRPAGDAPLRLEALPAGGSLSLDLLAPVALPRGRYLGHVTYAQIAHGERLAGIPVFSGMTFTDVFPFEVT